MTSFICGMFDRSSTSCIINIIPVYSMYARAFSTVSVLQCTNAGFITGVLRLLQSFDALKGSHHLYTLTFFTTPVHYLHLLGREIMRDNGVC